MTLLAPDPTPVAEAELPVTAEPTAAVTCAAAALAAGAFGWLAGAVFAGLLARCVGLAAAAVGALVVYLGSRTRRGAVTQYAGLAGLVLLAALLVLPDTRGNTGIPALVGEALRSGGLALPPVPFDPGWRFLLVLLAGCVGLATAAAAVAARRPRLPALLAVPLVVAAALLQPPGGEVRGPVISLVLLVGSLTVSLAADPDTTGATGQLGLRRVARAAAALVVVGLVLAGTAQLGFLFPTAAADRVVPPMRPQLPPPTPDRVLFRVTADRPAVWRLGTLDVYRSPAWLTPPFDPARLIRLHGAVPNAPAGPTVTATFTLADVAGRVLPGLANPVRVDGIGASYDPRTQVLRVGGTRPRPGTTYQVVAAAPPDGAALTAAGPPDRAVAEFLAVPAATPGVAALLAAAPPAGFARLQFVRRAYYARVLAAGSGRPVDVAPARVDQLLAGSAGTPYEIAAGEVLLARWAGVPARLGYGYFGGSATNDPRTVEVHPRDGATWLEAYFHGFGWVPIVGTPPRAQQSVDTHQQNTNPAVRASDQLALVAYVPVRRSSVHLLYQTVRYYLAVGVAVAAGLGLVVLAVPPLLRTLRRVARQRAGRRAGPAGEIAAAYAELRDRVTDLGLAPAGISPLALLDVLADDAEHRELAWLVTRCLWGDLRRDLTAADATTAAELARSVTRRLTRAQPGFTRLLAVTGTSSLTDPWSAELPGRWPVRRLRRLAVAAAGLAVAAGLAGSAAAGGPAPGPPAAADLAQPPARLGDVTLRPEPTADLAFRTAGSASLAAAGIVFSVHQGGVVQGSLQQVSLVPRLDTRSAAVRSQVLAGLGGGRFQPTRLGPDQVFRAELPEQTLLLWFSPSGRSYQLLVARRLFTESDQLFATLLAARRGERLAGLARLADVPVPDPRKGELP